MTRTLLRNGASAATSDSIMPSPARHQYRAEIDGLRAIAVLAVVLYHSGLMPNGYLGVDVFFVISGFLITAIIHGELARNRFSLAGFYVRRIRRILPLSLLMGAVALGVGAACMLPDDLENLAESVFATNVFANNVLQAITTKNYWDVVNEYKPMLHTWSLGVEEQFYFAYPMLLLATWKIRRNWVLPVTVGLALVSLGLYVAPFPAHAKFYYLPFRFFEIALGAVAALACSGRVVSHDYVAPLTLALVAVLVAGGMPLPSEVKVILVVVLTLGILISEVRAGTVAHLLLKNRVAVGLGLISYSVYMWHQILLAFGRYLIDPRLPWPKLLLLWAVLVIASVFTYNVVEKPFRDARRVSRGLLFVATAALFLLSTASAFVIYRRAGVLRDVPELDITSRSIEPGLHAAYNHRVFGFDRSFSRTDRTKVLVLGNSFARDWVNVLLESPFADRLEISYSVWPDPRGEAASRAAIADVVFVSDMFPGDAADLHADASKVWAVGTKSFGESNGVFYNRRGASYLLQRADPEPRVVQRNEAERQEWGERYIDLLGRVADAKGTVPVFTPAGKFISQDCRHLTRAGARWFAVIMADQIGSALRVARAANASDDAAPAPLRRTAPTVSTDRLAQH